MGEDVRSELDQKTRFTTPEEIFGYLALKHANGLSFADVLDLHTQILTRIGRDYIKTWTDPDDLPETSGQNIQHWVIQGGHYALSHLEDDDEWYTVTNGE